METTKKIYNISKTSKKNVEDLNKVLTDLKRTRDYILKDNVHFCIESDSTANNLYQNKEGIKLASLTKFYGSELCYLLNAIERLEKHITQAGRN